MKIALFCLVLIGFFMMKGIAHAAFPEKAITLIIPSSAGGNQDIVARTLIPSLEKELGVKIVAKNIGGASGTLGAAEVSKAAPDGYTIGFLSTGPATLQPQVRKLPYTVDSFTPVACVNDNAFALMVKRDSPMNTLADIKKFAQENNGEVAFGSPAPGGLTHISSVALFDVLGVKALHIPNVGSAEAMMHIAGGHTQFFSDALFFLKNYDVKALGVFSDKRDPEYPNVPTMKEQGYDLEFSAWGGIMAPKGTPDEIVAKLDNAVRVAVASPEFIEIAKKDGITIRYQNSKDFAVYLAQEADKGKKLIEKYNMRQE